MWWIVSVLVYLLPLGYIIYKTRWSQSMRSFALADQDVRALLLFASISATFIGPAYSIGFIGKGYRWGFLFFFFGLAYTIQNALVAYFIAPRMRNKSLEISTLGGYFEVCTHSERLRYIVGIVSVLVCIGFSAVMLQAGGTLAHAVLGCRPAYGIIGIAFITAVYSVRGGLKASIYTDVIQFAFFVFFVSLSVIFLLFVADEWSNQSFVNAFIALTKLGWEEFSLGKIFCLFFMFLLGETLIPPYVNRVFASDNAASARKSFWYSSLFSFVWFLFMPLIGIMAYVILGELPLNDDTVFFELANRTHSFLKYCIGISVLCIVMSSLDSLINAAAIAVCGDFFFKRGDKEKQRISRWAVGIVVVLAGTIALYLDSLISGLLMVYSIWAPAILPALFYTLCVSKPKPKVIEISILVGIICSVILFLVPADYDKAYIPFIVGFLASGLSIVILKNIRR